MPSKKKNGKQDEKIVEAIVFAEKEYTTVAGEKILVKPWGLRQGRLMFKRIIDFIEKISAKSDGDATKINAILQSPELLDLAFDEIHGIIKDTIGRDDEWMEENLTFEDFFGLAGTVIDVCFLREDGGGVLGKILSLAETGNLMILKSTLGTQSTSS